MSMFKMLKHGLGTLKSNKFGFVLNENKHGIYFRWLLAAKKYGFIVIYELFYYSINKELNSTN